MKKCIFKGFIFLLIISILTTFSIATAFADTNSWSWRYDSKTKTIYIEGSGDMASYGQTSGFRDNKVVPTEDPWEAVSNGKQPWKKYENVAKKIVIGDGITSVGLCAFYGFSKVKEITLGENVKTLKGNSFDYTKSLEKINFNEKLEDIECGVFYGFKGKLNSYILPRTVKEIEEMSLQAFDDPYDPEFAVIPTTAKFKTLPEYQSNFNLANAISAHNVILADSSFYDAKEKIENLEFKTRTMITTSPKGKKCIKVYAEDLDTSFIDELSAKIIRDSKVSMSNVKINYDGSVNLSNADTTGFTVKYDFYTSTDGKTFKKSKVVDKDVPVYYNTAAKKGNKYYYKIVCKVYDDYGHQLYTTDLKSTKYGVRTYK